MDYLWSRAPDVPIQHFQNLLTLSVRLVRYPSCLLCTARETAAERVEE
jgi:hypothetical protein